MHMADALLSPAVAATMYVASGTTVGLSVKKLTEDENTQKLPTMAVASALVFAGQMINYTIPGTGSSGHMCGGMLLSALLGPQAGFLSMAVVLTIQCLFFADGGLMALGANIWNMAFYGCFVGYYLIWRPIMRSRLFENLGAEAAQRARIIAASIIGCIVTLQMGAFSVVLETTLSGITELPFSAFCGLMLPIHLAIGLVEGLITAAVLTYVYAVRPESHWQWQWWSSAESFPISQAPTRTGLNGRSSETRRRATAPTWALMRRISARAALYRRRQQAFRRRPPSCRTMLSPEATIPWERRSQELWAAQWSRERHC